MDTIGYPRDIMQFARYPRRAIGISWDLRDILEKHDNTGLWKSSLALRYPSEFNVFRDIMSGYPYFDDRKSSFAGYPVGYSVYFRLCPIISNWISLF